MEIMKMLNHFRTALLLTMMTVFILLAGSYIGGPQGILIALFIAGMMNIVGYWFSDRIVLRMYRARKAQHEDFPEIYQIIRNLTDQSGLPMPKLYIIPRESPNAFATGRNPDHASVAVTQGLLDIMDHNELKGVLAHELSHIKNRDILVGTIAAVMGSAVMLLADMARMMAFFGGVSAEDEEDDDSIVGLVVMSILAPIAAMLIQTAVYRSREYMADAAGAKLAGSGQGLAAALEKIARNKKGAPMKARPSTAHMFIVTPLSSGLLKNLFSTHPPLTERISRLRKYRPT